MKTCITVEDGARDKRLDMEKADRMSVLFSGTSLVTSRNEGPPANLQQTPDGGCLCYVLRTGFSSSQGSFMQLIEYSTHKLSDGSKETGYALLFLLMFALVAAGYVFQKGMEKGDRTTHELLIKCVIIITATVPKQLPMQMAMAVNTALMGLMKNGVFCTEPFRVPTAGKISHCLFDKTGTITTDQLVPVGVVNMGASNSGEADQLQEGAAVRIEGLKARAELNGKNATVTGHTKEGRVSIELSDGSSLALKPSNCVALAHALCDVAHASIEVAMVLSSCHSMVDVDGVGLVGDPIEMAALRGIGWRYNGSEESCKPGNWEPTEKTLKELEDTLAKMKPDDKKRDDVTTKIASANERIEKSKERAKNCTVSNIQIVQRHHFESGLQRMSVVAKATSKKVDYDGFFCLVKGSPEAIGALLAADAKPEWYDGTYQKMAQEGMRVLALAIRRCPEIKSPKAEELKKTQLGRERTEICWFHCI
jgi:cation-transporting ATPase 13A1